MIRCLDSRCVVEEDRGSMQLPILEEANFFEIKKGKLRQFRVNPAPREHMHKLPAGARSVVIGYERHRGSVCYTLQFMDDEGNNLKAYNL